ncbi:MAG: GGDEF domain-containing protein [Hyphococcus sp.]
MKITDLAKATRPQRASAAKAASGAGKGASAEARAAEPAVRVSLAGIPEAELTPKVREALMSLMSEVQSLREELAAARAQLSELEKLADRDPLLDVYNRRAFVRELERALSMIERYDLRASLIFIDLNGMKQINDGKGHAAGDAALAHVASVVAANIRQTDILGRLGGDEFGVLLTHADQAIAMRKADDLAARVGAAPVPWEGGDFMMTISVGAVEIQKGGSVADAMERADNAMYAVKRGQ